MKAVRLHAYGEPLRLDDVPEPTITGPHDVIVRVAGAGLCRTDVHIRDGWFAPAVPSELPLVLGHETTGWVHEAGPAVENVSVGDAVICHPQQSCGLCAACRIGDDMRCAAGLTFNGLTRPGGFAELLKTSDRAVLRLPDGPGTRAGRAARRRRADRHARRPQGGADPRPGDPGRGRRDRRSGPHRGAVPAGTVLRPR